MQATSGTARQSVASNYCKFIAEFVYIFLTVNVFDSIVTAAAQSSTSSRFNDLIPTLGGSSWRQMLSVAALNMEISPTNLSCTHHRVDFSSTVEEVCAS